MAGEHDFYTITEVLRGWDEYYSSVSEFKNELKADLLSSDEDSLGCVFWSPERDDGGSTSYNSIINIPTRRIQEKIIVALKKITSKLPVWSSSLLQFWASRVHDGRPYLTTLDQPFAVTSLNKGSCWYRKQCMEHYHIVDGGSRAEEFEPPVRVFRSGHPESSPNLCLYTIKEFPLRNCAVRCGFLNYVALPVFDLHHSHCVGVLEVLFGDSTVQYDIYNSTANWFQIFNNSLEEAEMRSTHIQSTQNLEIAQQQQAEIWNMLEWAIDILPQLHMAQVWVPCLQCDDRLGCMERVAFIDNVKKKMNIQPNEDKHLHKFNEACRFHNVQKGQGVVGLALSSPNKSCFCRNLCDFTISEYPMAHYAQLARLSFCFAIRLQSKEMVNEVYIVEFFLQSESREDAYIWYVLQVMEEKLNSFKIATGPHLGEELIVDEVRKKYKFTSPELGQNTVFPLEYEIIKHGRKHEHQNSQEITFAEWMEGYKDIISLSEFRESLKTDMSYLRLTKNSMGGWIFWSMEGEELSENEGSINSKPHNSPIEQNVKHLLEELSCRRPEEPNHLIQFWAHKMIDNRFSLTASDQPFALGFLCKGLCELRKQCMEHYYYVDDGAKDEELGPPGRVFLNGLPESTPDLRLYSTREFPLRNHVVFCGGRRYLVLPLFDSYEEKCVGVLEIVEFSSCLKYDFDLECIGEILKETKLRSTHHINSWSSLQASHLHPNTYNGDGQQLALMEIKRMFKLLAKTPQLHLAQVCVPCFQCSNIMQQAHCQVNDDARYDVSSQEFVKACQLHQVHTEKGVCGRVLESKNKLCFCQNLCDFSIIEQPLAHYAQLDRLDTCFAIGLQSSHSKDSLYLLEFFLSPGSKKDGYPWSFVRFLLQIMKQNLTSFKVASGHQLGDELIVEVIKDYEYTSFKLDQLRLQVVEYDHQMGQCLHNQGVPFECADSARNVVVTTTSLEGRITTKTCNKDFAEIFEVTCRKFNAFFLDSDHNGMDDGMNISDAEQSDIAAANVNEEVRTNQTKRSRKETSFHINLADLEPDFGKHLEDVARELGVGKSTLKRACRRDGVERWPGKEQNKRNPSLFLKENAADHFQDRNAETSISSGTNNPSLDLTAHQNKAHTKTESTQQLAKISCPETDMIMVKATFEGDILKFQMRISSGMGKLKEEVGKRLKLKIESFKLKYLDEGGGESILLACEEDFQLCVKTLTAVDKTCIQVFVESIDN